MNTQIIHASVEENKVLSRVLNRWFMSDKDQDGSDMMYLVRLKCQRVKQLYFIIESKIKINYQINSFLFKNKKN